MTGQHALRAFLAEHTNEHMIDLIAGTLEKHVNEAEAKYRSELANIGYSSSYVALLSVVATMSADAGYYLRAAEATDQELRVWRGYHQGMQSALACLAMHETGTAPKHVGKVIVRHLEELVGCRLLHGPTGQDG